MEERDKAKKNKQIQMEVLRNLCSLIDMLKIGDSSQLLVDHRAVRTSFESHHVHAAEGLS